uniref:Cell division protein ftsZ putative n=1 Tax=Albugo laibachii Nc14 TaxID=890382 RepID=F0WA38_9STRA|nr:cell division protein ftsZ putative [Albugo laibachii Nc14]|eukprot:CCA18008.1 cell division protein ftsZ putative [Albugo laibachii Nc14]
MGNRATLLSVCAARDIHSVIRILDLNDSECGDIESQDEFGRTPLLVTAGLPLEGDQEEIQEEVICEISDQEHSDSSEEGENTEILRRKSQEMRLPHTYASRKIHILHLLLQRLANINHQDENGRTALHFACHSSDASAVRMMIHEGAKTIRDHFGLLPQDLIVPGHRKKWNEEISEMKAVLDEITDESPYKIQAFSFRSSGITKLELGRQVEKNATVNIEYDVPEDHSSKDYIQILYTLRGSLDMEIGSYHFIPRGSRGCVSIRLGSIPCGSTVHFVYVQSDINRISRKVVASGCNAIIQSLVNEIVQYELFLYNRVLEVESIPEFEFLDQPLILLKRIGVAKKDTSIEWVDIRPNNHIVAVNDNRIDQVDFSDAIQILHENNGKECTKLLIQNYAANGDFIPEKILGVGVVGKHAFLLPQNAAQDEKEVTITEGIMEQWTGEEPSSKTYYGSDTCEMGIKEEKVQEEREGAYDSSSNSSTIETAVSIVAQSIWYPNSNLPSLYSIMELYRAQAWNQRVATRAFRAFVAATHSTAYSDRKINGQYPQKAKIPLKTHENPTESFNRITSENRTKQSLSSIRLRREEALSRPIHQFYNKSKPRTYKEGKPLITVMGLGGAGSNAINNMILSQLEGVEFVVANTDCQALGRSMASRKINLGKPITKGLGAGSKPELGRASAELERSEIESVLKDSHMLFITGGMGGGTCTGAAPVVAGIAKEMGILTVGVVSTPFRSEGPNRTRVANAGVKELGKIVDTLIVVPNQNLLALSTKKTTILEAFRYADDVLLEGVKGVTDLIIRPGLINLDFADINTILSNAGRAIMGSGSSNEPSVRALQAAEEALINPLLGDLPMESASGLLVTIRGGEDLRLHEVDEIMQVIRNRVAEDANIIFGTCYDQSLEGCIQVTIIVSGIQTDVISPPIPSQRIKVVSDAKEIGSQTEEAKESTGKEASQTSFFGRYFSL